MMMRTITVNAVFLNKWLGICRTKLQVSSYPNEQKKAFVDLDRNNPYFNLLLLFTDRRDDIPLANEDILNN